jgi:hypothetical protein
MVYPQYVANGYYNSIKNNTYIYVYNDTIILPYYSCIMGISILKGVIDKKRKWINLIPVKDKMESSYSIVEKKKNDDVSILRFSLYGYFTGTMFGEWYDGSSLANETFLRCYLVYTTPQNKLVEEYHNLIFNGKYFEISLPSDLFINAELTVRGSGKYVTVPILKDTLLFVDIVKSPSVYYHDKQKRMKFRYSEDDQSIDILFNMPYNKQWNKFVKAEKPHENKRYQQAIEKHINDMRF